jgi:Cu2+-exporting ATPase
MLLFENEIYNITGMSSSSCASSIEHILSKIDGVEKVTVNLLDSTATISYNSDLITPLEMNLMLSEVGYGLIENKNNSMLEDNEEITNNEFLTIKHNLIWSALLTTLVLLISLYFSTIPFSSEIMLLFTSIILFSFGKEFFANAWNLAIKGLVSMDTLIAIGTGTIWLMSTFNAFFPSILDQQAATSLIHFKTTAVIITLILFGKYYEAKS